MLTRDDDSGARDTQLAARNLLQLGASLFFTWGIALGMRFLLPRYLGPDRFGTLSFADAFAATFFVALGASYGESIGVFDFRDVRMNRALDVIKAVEQQIERGERLVFATRSIRQNMATIPLARATDGAILCVSMGSTSMRLAGETIEQIGKDRFIGSILVRPSSDEGKARPVTPSEWRLEAPC